MSERKRLRRKDPVRVGPLRNFANLYRPTGLSNDKSDSESPVSLKQARGQAGGESKPSEGVGLAYRVIEKYLNDGLRTAEQLNAQPYGTRPMAAPLQELIDRMLRYQADMVPLWLDLLGSLVRADPAAPVYSRRPDARGMTNGVLTNSKFSIETASRQPVEVSLDLQLNSEHIALATPGLHALDSRKPALTDIRFVPATSRNRAKLSIRIPTRQPAGVYSGVVIDRASGDTRGTLSIRVASGRRGTA